MAEPGVSIESSERTLKVSVREERAGWSGLGFTLPALAAAGVFYWRALGGNFAPEAFANIHWALHAAAGPVLLAALAGLFLPARRPGRRGVSIELSGGAPSMMRQKAFVRGEPSGEQGIPIDRIKRFDLRWAGVAGRSWATLKLVPLPTRAAKVVALTTDGLEHVLTPFAQDRLLEVAKMVDALNSWLFHAHALMERDANAGFADPFLAPPDPRKAAEGPAKARRVVNARRTFRVFLRLAFGAGCLAAAAVAWRSKPLSAKADPLETLRLGAIAAAAEAKELWAEGALPWEEPMPSEPEKLMLFSGGDFPDETPPPAAPGSRPALLSAAPRPEGAPEPVMELSIGGPGFHETPSEPYGFEESFLATEFAPVSGAQAVGMLAVMVRLFEDYKERETGSRPALEKLAGLLGHPDERLAIASAACLGLVGDKPLLRPLEDKRRELVIERQAHRGGGPPPGGRLLAKVIEAQERIKEREAKR